MIDVCELRGLIAKRGHTQSSLARAIGISPKTFYEKMGKGVFSSTEIEAMVDVLRIENPWEIFFTKNVALNATSCKTLSYSVRELQGGEK